MSDFQVNKHEVDYETYCEYCKYHDREGFEDPCDACLEEFCRDGTSIPLNYEPETSDRTAPQKKQDT